MKYVDKRTFPARRRYVDYRSVRALIARLPLTNTERDLAHIMTRGIWEGRRKDGAYDIAWLAETMRVSRHTAQRALRTVRLYGLVEPDGRNGSRRRFQLGESLLEAVELPTDQGVRLLTDRHLAYRSEGGRPRVYDEPPGSHAKRQKAYRERLRDETLAPLSEKKRLPLATKGYGAVTSPGAGIRPYPQAKREVDVKEDERVWDEEAEGPTPEQEEEWVAMLTDADADGLEEPGAAWLDLQAEGRPPDLAEDEPLESWDDRPDDWFWQYDIEVAPEPDSDDPRPPDWFVVNDEVEVVA